MRRAFVFLYGLVAYAAFLVTFLYAVGFVSGFVVPKAINSGAGAPLGEALAVNVALLGLFGLQHSVMARQGFKKKWTRIVPRPLERSTFVFFTCAVLGLIFWQWRPVTDVVWQVDYPAANAGLWSLAALGWVIVLVSTFVIDHFELFGLRQVYLYARGREARPPTFKVSALYRYVRHPLMLGFLVAFWATPRMTLGHLIFAAVTSAYVLVAIQIEERDLVRFHGQAYADYRKRVPMLVPFLRRRSAERPGGSRREVEVA